MLRTVQAHIISIGTELTAGLTVDTNAAWLAKRLAAIGVVANFFTNPLTFAPVRPIDNIGVWAELLERMGDRGNFSDTIDSILYDSADSYAQSRIIYLQNRRFELAGDDDDAYSDLYDDPYADIYGDAYAE